MQPIERILGRLDTSVHIIIHAGIRRASVAAGSSPACQSSLNGYSGGKPDAASWSG